MPAKNLQSIRNRLNQLTLDEYLILLEDITKHIRLSQKPLRMMGNRKGEISIGDWGGLFGCLEIGLMSISQPDIYQPIQAYSTFRCLNGQISMNFWRNSN